MIKSIACFFVAIVMSFLELFGIGTAPKPTGYDIMADISYGDEEAQKLDLIIPQGIGQELCLSIFIHGGAWMGGDKSYETKNAIPMAEKRGMISANVNYRLLSSDRKDLDCRTQLDDIDKAITKIVQVCNDKGYTIKKAIIWGKSAGGHLSLMYAYTYKDKSAVDIGLVYSICGPTDMMDTNFFSKTEFTTEQVLLLNSVLTGREVTLDNLLSDEIVSERMRVSPVNYVTTESVPTIFNSCGRDNMVPTSNAQRLEKALQAFGVDHYYGHFAHSNHCGRHAMDFFSYTVFDYHLDRMIDKYVK
ncbi:MAG: alpha/beta hydrolase [Clostridia bacterium]|nr:alpha/beta hydrolase [Clostridia bacterium]